MHRERHTPFSLPILALLTRLLDIPPDLDHRFRPGRNRGSRLIRVQDGQMQDPNEPLRSVTFPLAKIADAH